MWLKWIGRAFAFLAFALVAVPVVLLLIFRFVPVPGAPQMAIAAVEGKPVSYSWREYDRISPYLERAVIGSEDQDFCTHHGFDWKAIHDVWERHQRNPKWRMRGASTISQETARSLFATPIRSWVRKGVEAYETVLMEFLWPKRRILTAYLNLVDWGNGAFGAEAASERYFGKPASALTAVEAARLAAVLPDPDKWNAAKPGPYVRGRTGAILERMHEVTRDGLDWCVKG